MPWKYAHGSVIIFFVLSGYLISLSIANTASFWQYLRKRSLRIYSVYAPALICSLLICDIGLIDTHSLKLLFFYDSPSLSHQVNNQPIWSLSFEVHYYLVFGVASYLKRGAIFTFILASFFLPVDTLILFPCWLSGVALRCLKRNEWSYKLNICLMLVSSSSLVVIYNKNLPLHDWIMTKQWQLYDIFLSPIDLGYARVSIRSRRQGLAT